jgi:hypothetical protein
MPRTRLSAISSQNLLPSLKMTSRKWAPSFLDENNQSISSKKSALIILNQPFSLGLLWRTLEGSSWKACADGGANRLYDLFSGELEDLRIRYLGPTTFHVGKLNGLVS